MPNVEGIVFMWARTYNEIFKSALVYIKRFVWYNVCDSQSAFNFLRRLHYHTSCSYQVDKSCSYRVFSPQELKQNDSRTSCSSSNCCTNFRETTRKREKKKSLCETCLNPLSANPTKWSNTLKQFVAKLVTNCLSMFDHFVGLALKGLKEEKTLKKKLCLQKCC